MPNTTVTKNTYSIFEEYNNGQLKGRIMLGDSLSLMKDQNAETCDLIFLDPPFNLGKTYSYKDLELDKKPEKDYHLWIEEVVLEASRLLKPGGSLYCYHMPLWAMRIGNILESKLDFRHWIAISMKNGFVRGNNLYPAHYALLYFTKGVPSSFQRPKINPMTCRHCGNYVKDYGGYKSIIDEKGINLSDFWEDLSPVRHSTTKHRSANELPNKLFERIFQISGSVGGLFFDPFSGSGTGIISAIKANMEFIGSDIVEDNCKIINQRISRYCNLISGETSNVDNPCKCSS